MANTKWIVHLHTRTQIYTLFASGPMKNIVFLPCRALQPSGKICYESGRRALRSTREDDRELAQIGVLLSSIVANNGSVFLIEISVLI